MKKTELRHKVISALLQASGPLTLEELLAESGLTRKALQPILKELVGKGQVAEGELVPGKPAPQYCWGARWGKVTEREVVSAKQRLRAAVDAVRKDDPRELDIDGDPVRAFHNFIINPSVAEISVLKRRLQERRASARCGS